MEEVTSQHAVWDKLSDAGVSGLGHISKHSLSLSEMVLEAEVFPAALRSLRDPDEYVRKDVATLLRELSQVIVNWGGLGAVIDYLGSSHGKLTAGDHDAGKCGGS